MLRMATGKDPFYSLTCTLDGSSFIFDFKYNQRTDTWTIYLRDVEGVLLMAGVKVVPNMMLLRKQAYREDFPLGDLMCVSYASDDDSPPGLEDLVEGGRCDLIYLEGADLLAALLES